MQHLCQLLVRFTADLESGGDGAEREEQGEGGEGEAEAEIEIAYDVDSQGEEGDEMFDAGFIRRICGIGAECPPDYSSAEEHDLSDDRMDVRS